MAYFIFLKNSDNIEGTLSKIAENKSDLDNCNITQSDYKIIEDSQENFNLVKLNLKIVSKYNGDTIIYSDIDPDISDKNNIIFFKDSILLKEYINGFKKLIKNFLDSNKNHSLYNKWNNYYSQLSNLDISTIQFPMKKTLEQHFQDLNLPSLNTLQLP